MSFHPSVPLPFLQLHSPLRHLLVPEQRTRQTPRTSYASDVDRQVIKDEIALLQSKPAQERRPHWKLESMPLILAMSITTDLTQYNYVT